MASNDPDISGRVLGGRYAVDALIGKGGFGAVYRGTHLRLGDTVAIKVIADPLPDLSARFHREARVQRRLRHPVTVRLLDFDVEADGLHYMVQEFVDGRTLKAVLREEGPLAPWRLVSLMSAVLDALEEAHGLGIIHRDLKPENIMVCEGRAGEEARLLDFGIAKLRDREAGDETLTAQGMVLGTVPYMAPEQIVRSPLGPATDVYQLGAVMYRLLSGRKPFNGTAQVVLRQHLAVAPPPLPAMVPPQLAAVVMRAMEKEPDRRYASAGELKAALVATRTSILATSPAVSRLDMESDATTESSLPVAARLGEPTASSSLHHPRGELAGSALRLAVTRPRQVVALAALALVLAAGVGAAAWWRLGERPGEGEPARIAVGMGAASSAGAAGAAVPGAAMPGAAMPGAAMPGAAVPVAATIAAAVVPAPAAPAPAAVVLDAVAAAPAPAAAASAAAARPTPAAATTAERIAAADARAAAAQARIADRMAAASRSAVAAETAAAAASTAAAEALRAAAPAAAAPAANNTAERTRAFAAALETCACPTADALLAELAPLDPDGTAGRRRLYRNACQIAGPRSCLR